MATIAARLGDQVEVNYVKRFVDGSTITSRLRGPTQVTIGIEHPRLPGLGLALVGKIPGSVTQIITHDQQAYGQPSSARVYKLFRSRFAPTDTLEVGKWVKYRNRKGTQRLVRILDIDEPMIFVESHQHWDALLRELEVELVAILEPAAATAD
jgi:FKBP-type peptidyl-prolyl cis-trans isomerase 2